MKIKLFVATLIGYNVHDIWDFMLVWRHYHPDFRAMVVEAIFSSGWLFFHSGRLVRLADATAYGLVAYFVLLSTAKYRQLFPADSTSNQE